MCGINGLISKRNLDSSYYIKTMNDLITHRGPDGEGFYVEQGHLAMGMRRLAVIDLILGDQPIYSENKQIVVVFNGEIYNFKKIKEELKNKHGCIFNTNSDTEVILRGYEVWGKEVVQYLNGMFAFAIYDKLNNKILIARDRFGEKPLYYFKKEDSFFWGSELKSVFFAYKNLKGEKPKINREALSLYFQLTYIPAPYSIYEHILKLEAGHLIEIDTDSLCYEVFKYWTKDEPQQNEINDYKQAQKILKNILYESVEEKMIADVPLGIFLSGGVDSSIITAIAKDLKPNEKIQTFSIGFTDKRFDESERISLVSKHLNVDNHLFMLESDQIIMDIDRIISNYDEPFADSSALPTYQVSKMTREQVTVALTGDGGDEVFGGYNRYQMTNYANIYRTLIPFFLHEPFKRMVNNLETYEDRKSITAKSKKFLDALGKNKCQDQLNIIKLGFNDNDLKKLIIYPFETGTYFNKKYNETLGFSPLKKSRFLDKSISLEGDMLVKVDRASMLVSLECRAPFLDHRLWEFTNSIPDNFLIKNGNKKRILKETFSDLLPQNFFNLEKSGFGVPVGEWLKTSLKSELNILTEVSFLEEQKIFNASYVKILVQEHLNSIRDHTFKLWTLYCFQKWYKLNV